MVYIHIRHTVENYSKWREIYDQHAPARQAGGATEEAYILRNTENPKEVILLLGWNNAVQARAFTQSTSLKQAMQDGGVVGSPDIRILESAD